MSAPTVTRARFPVQENTAAPFVFTPTFPSFIPGHNGRPLKVKAGVIGLCYSVPGNEPEYVCTDCGYSNRALRSVMSHRNVHGPRRTLTRALRNKTEPAATAVETAPRTTVEQAVAQIEQALDALRAQAQSVADTRAVDKARAERDEWKARAVKAERDLARLRKALNTILPSS